MLDWLTMRVARRHIAPATLQHLLDRVGRVTKTNNDGEIVWCISARESVRSDSHQVVVHVGSEKIELSGSPARVLGHNNVFGSGDAFICWSAMVRHVAKEIGSLPLHPELWECSRVDVTHNYALADASEVRQALMYLRHVEGGRLQVRTHSESVYWSAGSRSRSAKAYHKGPHLERQLSRGEAYATPDQVEQSQRLLRLELSLRLHWWRRQLKAWYEFSEREFDQEHEKFFGEVIGKVEVPVMEKDMVRACEKVAVSKGQGVAAFRTWMLIRQVGAEQARSMMSRASWTRHKRILFDAGLTWADFQASNVVQLRRRTIVLDEPVRSWDELRRAA